MSSELRDYFYRKVENFNRRHHIRSLKHVKAAPGDLYLRLWVLPYNRPVKCFGISKVNNLWHCNYYASGRKLEIERSDKDWEESLDIFLKNDIQTLPDESKLKWDLYMPGKHWTVRKIYILHGWFYSIEISWDSDFHSFSYYAPEAHYWPEAIKMCRIRDEFNKIRPLRQRD